jgi:LPXTG-site transpeptidase (sortase) family protein
MLPILPKTAPHSQELKNKASKGTGPKRKDKKKIFTNALLIVGIVLCLSQIIPLSISFMQGNLTAYADSNAFIPVTQSFLQQLITTQYTDPGSEYFNNVVAAQNKQPFTINTDYKESMALTIKSANINGVKLSSNITGANKEIYEGALREGIAHLKGTPLPGDGGTSIIYGHSGLSGLLTSPNNPQIIFSRLDAATIGDKITIRRDNKDLQYIVSSKKIVESSDLTFINDAAVVKEKITLITCWPLGIGTKRLVLIADRIYE